MIECSRTQLESSRTKPKLKNTNGLFIGRVFRICTSIRGNHAAIRARRKDIKKRQAFCVITPSPNHRAHMAILFFHVLSPGWEYDESSAASRDSDMRERADRGEVFRSHGADDEEIAAQQVTTETLLCFFHMYSVFTVRTLHRTITDSKLFLQRSRSRVVLPAIIENIGTHLKQIT